MVKGSSSLNPLTLTHNGAALPRSKGNAEQLPFGANQNQLFPNSKNPPFQAQPYIPLFQMSDPASDIASTSGFSLYRLGVNVSFE